MKAVILAGGFGTRISEETQTRPKPMVEIGGKPVLWHIMKSYAFHGINDFIICCGYKGYLIKEYFANYALHQSDVTFDMRRRDVIIHQSSAEPWSVTLVDTGEETATGGRLRRVAGYLDGEDFCFTYGDGVSDVDIGALITFHRERGTLATVTAVHPPGRFGVLTMTRDKITAFAEKSEADAGWINGGYFVLSPKAIEYVASDDTAWEREPMERLARDGQLSAFTHTGFWQPLDTLRDRNLLNDLWKKGEAPWKKWP
ncbi:MAG TPA: glucose-1-phosphate cytidylyltransferase [Candidatus Eremiobacteraceae bacterium]|nr:glucose-1-phosphate cytidylyltransferase [Candidatus Eremiobacteraceae bacterium]